MGNDVGRVRWELGGQDGSTAAVQAGSEGGRREVDGFKKTLGAQTGSLADGLDTASGRWGVGGRLAASVSGSLSHPGLVPRTQSWPPRSSCSGEEFSRGEPRNSYRVMGETRPSYPRTSCLTLFRSLPHPQGGLPDRLVLENPSFHLFLPLLWLAS